MNIDKIRFNHLPRGSERPQLKSNALNIEVGAKTYVAVSSNTGLVKIGRSTNYEGRIKEIERTQKDVLLIVAVFNDNREKRLHRRFADVRAHGEWFKLDFDQVAQLRGEGHIQ